MGIVNQLIDYILDSGVVDFIQIRVSTNTYNRFMMTSHANSPPEVFKASINGDRRYLGILMACNDMVKDDHVILVRHKYKNHTFKLKKN